jgi:DNA-binding GntR family transcriptional regulator
MPRHAASRNALKSSHEEPPGVFSGADTRRFPLDRRMPVALQIAGVLRDMILKLELEPGAVISKDDVAKAFGVSSMPVREALRKLEEEGLVVIKPQSGTYVTTIDVRWAKEAQFLRIGVEVEVLRHLVKAITEPEIQELERILSHQQLAYEANDKEGFSRDDAAFHAAMYRMVGVGGLWQKIGSMRVHIDRLRLMHLPIGGKMSRVLVDHRDILDAIRGRDAEAAEAALRKHLSGTLSLIETLREKYPHYF